MRLAVAGSMLAQQLVMLLPLLLPLAAIVAGHSNYNSVYNEVITPELKQAIDKELPKQAKFFDELDREYLTGNANFRTLAPPHPRTPALPFLSPSQSSQIEFVA